MSNQEREEYIARLAKRAEELKNDPKKRRAFFVDAGIAKESGKFTEEYKELNDFLVRK